ncbi:hybrid sensor histidine kinase/response regulator [Roseofilum capinflatum]|uniref:histidine kinase n=1 Tax=Roseofilum capinflatum BLCC-M114 TaxID=3022440 RepID=A0ABT7B5M2_9CYAN|nr:hybrid sensor histidine kinase/response regulator [Roseofilum capinflatum]MDJ1174459.1 ATP-binding protein [Roseofilum capinflatum BLCC-M114]
MKIPNLKLSEFAAKDPTLAQNETDSLSDSLLLKIIVGITTLGVSMATYYSYQVLRNSYLESLKQNAILEVQGGVDEVDKWLATQKAETAAIAASPTLQTMDWSQVEPYLQAEETRLKDFFYFAMVNPDGSYYNTKVGFAKGKNLKDRKHIKMAMAGTTYVSDPVPARTLNDTTIVVVTAPVWSLNPEEKTPIGVTSGIMSLEQVTNVVSGLNYGNGSYAFALNAEGEPIIYAGDRVEEVEEKEENQDFQRLSQQILRKERGIEGMQIDGKKVYIAHVPITEADWSIALVIPRENIESQLRPLEIIALVVAGLTILTIAILQQVQRFKQRQLQRSKEAADAANQAKSAFIANMSHELRSPLNAILGFTQIMTRSQTLPKEHQESVSIINRSGEHLLTLINNVLDLSKIEAGRVTLNPKNFDLHRLLDDIHDMFQLKAADKGLHLSLEPAPNLPRYIRTDEVKLRQILINLINNALKFTQQGGICVRSQSMNNSKIAFEVEDTGPGIAPEDLKTLFEAFSQTESGKQSQEGTGLGLSISRQFVQVMGGEMHVSSTLGKGTIFTFEIAYEEVEATEIENQQVNQRRIIGLEPDQPRYRILIVDDKSINRQLLVKLLNPLGFELNEASNGKEAVEMCEQWQPHLIWMDMRMPVMNGFEATQKIKATTAGQATAIIALTASVLEEERAVVVSAGCDDFLRKPFREDDIFKMMEQHLGVRYVYEDLTQSQQENLQEAEVLSSENILAFPPEVLVQLRRAVVSANKREMATVVEAIAKENTALAEAIASCCHNFEYDKILNLIPQDRTEL